MNAYRIEVVTQTFYILAESEESAESQYANYWSELECDYHPEKPVAECGCIRIEEDVYHNTELIGRE